MKAKNMILQKHDASIAFSIRRRKNIAVIDYWQGTEFEKQIECEVDKANEFYSKAIAEGFTEAF